MATKMFNKPLSLKSYGMLKGFDAAVKYKKLKYETIHAAADKLEEAIKEELLRKYPTVITDIDILMEDIYYGVKLGLEAQFGDMPMMDH